MATDLAFNIDPGNANNRLLLHGPPRSASLTNKAEWLDDGCGGYWVMTDPRVLDMKATP